MRWKYGSVVAAALAAFAIASHGSVQAQGADTYSVVARGHECWTAPSRAGAEVEAEICLTAMYVEQSVQTPAGNFKYTSSSWDEFTVTQSGQRVYSASHSAHVHDLEDQGELLSVHTQLSETWWSADQTCTARIDYRFKIAAGEVIFEVVDLSGR